MRSFLILRSMKKYLILMVLLWSSYLGVLTADEKKCAMEYQRKFLNNQQLRLLDLHATNTLPKCHFLYDKKLTNIVKKESIDHCVESFNSWFWADGNYKLLKIPDKKINQFRILDDYLGSKLMPYVLRLKNEDQALLLRKIVTFRAGNLIFIQTLINHGVSVEQVLLQQISDGGGFWASCDAYMIFLNKNLDLYKKNESLYEPIPAIDDNKYIKSSFRWEDLHHLADPTYNICPKVIERLAKANPSLLNKKSSYDGATPLHYYLRGISTMGMDKERLKLVGVLSTSTNINMQSNNGNTPLHDFIENISNDSSKTNKKIIEIMIARGANINLKNKSGISVKDLLAKRPDLMELIK